MASKSSILAVTILAETAKLKKGLSDAKSQLNGFSKNVSSMSRKVNVALGAIGLNLGVQGLKNMAQAAIEDSKAQQILARSMRNATGANDDQIKSAEEYIQKLQMQTAILDDELRPAFSTFYRTTKDITASQKLLALATDVSVATGKDLGMVSQALAKAYAGQFTSLNKLIPGIAKAKNPMQELEKTFAGMAETGAKNNPFARMNIILNDIAEKLGMAILPYIEQFANWLASPEGSARLETITGQLATILDLAGQAAFAISDFFKAQGNKGVTLVKDIPTFFQSWWDGFKNSIAKFMQSPGMDRLERVSAAKLNYSKTNLQDTKPQTFDWSKYLSSTKAATALAKTKSTLTSAVKTLQDELKSVQDGIKEFTEKFRNAVDLSFGIIDTGFRKVFRVDRFVREMRRMKEATKDLTSNLDILRGAGGSAGNSLIEQIIGLPPEEAAVVAREFANNLGAFQEAIALGGNLSTTGNTVGQMASQMQGNQTEQQMLTEIKLLNKQLATGKNTYNIKSDMSANEIVAAIRKWEKSTGKKVLVS